MVWDFENGGVRSFARKELDDPNFDLSDIFNKPEPNRTPRSVREGGYPITKEYQCWEWPVINWIHTRLCRQLKFVDEQNTPEGIKMENHIDVQPTMFGYSIQLDESNIIYNVTHKEVLDKCFSPKWIIDHMITARRVTAEDRGDRFEDKHFTKYIMLMLGMTRLPGQQQKIR